MRNVGELSERLKSRMEEETSVIEGIASEELRSFGEKLRGSVSSELNTIKSDIGEIMAESLEKSRSLKKWLIKTWIRPFLMGLCFSLGIFFGSWVLMQFISHSIENQLEKRAVLVQEIEEQQKTLKQIEAKTWGVKFYEDSRGRFLIAPKGVELSSWIVGGLSAAKLGK